MKILTAADLDGLDFTRGDGLITVVVQHARTGVVLMLAHANRAALERTLEQGEMWFWSRSRSELWHKGATSGNTQRLIALHADCDSDAVLALVEPAGPACHTGAESCFDGRPTLPALAAVIGARRTAVEDARRGSAASGNAQSEQSYTARLLTNENLRLKKLGEEAIELALACRAQDATAASDEAADLVYHVLVACAAAGVELDDVLRVLERRRSAAAPSEEQPVYQQQHDRTENRNRE
ncbi:MAG: bifunctional phosphoribosyl-AMP cyclohydrolase/phosphoribosyl-ATP diphosphatase HisIE [Longimicrobiales bacterium]